MWLPAHVQFHIPSGQHGLQSLCSQPLPDAGASSPDPDARPPSLHKGDAGQAMPPTPPRAASSTRWDTAPSPTSLNLSSGRMDLPEGQSGKTPPSSPSGVPTCHMWRNWGQDHKGEAEAPEVIWSHLPSSTETSGKGSLTSSAQKQKFRVVPPGPASWNHGWICCSCKEGCLLGEKCQHPPTPLQTRLRCSKLSAS